MRCQISLGVLAPLADLIAVVVVPGAALVDDIALGSQIQHVSDVGNALAEHDIKFSLLEGRRDLVLHDADPCAVTDHLAALLEGLDPSHIHTDGRIELERAAAGSCLRIAEHDADLLTELVDKDDGTVGLADDSREFAQGL